MKAVLFPGIGYTNDRSLLYFSGRIAASAGYDVIRVSYSGFPKGAKGDSEKMRQCYAIAKEQAEQQLKDVEWDGDVLFISKSIGTVVASDYAAEHGIDAGSILFTPLADTFRFPHGRALAFHGTADPWADTKEITSLCEEQKLPLYIEKDANHSLETGDVKRDLAILLRAMGVVRDFVG